MKDKRYKLAFKLMLETGLRVSEVSNLKKDDIQFIRNTQNTYFFISRLKGGNTAKIKISLSKYVRKELEKLIENTNENTNLFHSRKTLINKANQKNIQCHDLRRIFAKETYKKFLKNSMDKNTAENSTRKSLNHKKISTTKIYLKRKKFI